MKILNHKLASLLLLALFLFPGCKKETIESVTEESIVIDTNLPSIILTTLYTNYNLKIGESLNIQGQAIDTEGLASIHYKIETPDASYNYIYSDSIIATGTSHSFDEEISIPRYASVGTGNITFYVKDISGNVSPDYSRDFVIKDLIPSDDIDYVDSLSFNDSLEISIFRNVNNVVDSISVFNITKSLLAITVKETGGFKKMILTQGKGETIYNGKTYDLTDGVTKVYYTIKDMGIYDNFDETHSFRMDFQEYDSELVYELDGNAWSGNYPFNEFESAGLPIKAQ